MYRTAVFTYHPPIEWEFDEADELVEPGGRALTEAIAASLTEVAGPTSPVERHEDYGWAFACRFGEDSFYQVLNGAGSEGALTIQMDWYRLKALLLRRPRASFERYCRRVAAALASIDGVSEVRFEDYRS
jgi:hypothetical protein